MNQMAFKIKGETSDSEDGLFDTNTFQYFLIKWIDFNLAEPESSSSQVEKDESAINQDGWLNALSLEKLTTTVW